MTTEEFTQWLMDKIDNDLGIETTPYDEQGHAYIVDALGSAWLVEVSSYPDLEDR